MYKKKNYLNFYIKVTVGKLELVIPILLNPPQ